MDVYKVLVCMLGEGDDGVLANTLTALRYRCGEHFPEFPPADRAASASGLRAYIGGVTLRVGEDGWTGPARGPFSGVAGACSGGGSVKVLVAQCAVGNSKDEASAEASERSVLSALAMLGGRADLIAFCVRGTEESCSVTRPMLRQALFRHVLRAEEDAWKRCIAVTTNEGFSRSGIERETALAAARPSWLVEAVGQRVLFLGKRASQLRDCATGDAHARATELLTLHVWTRVVELLPPAEELPPPCSIDLLAHYIPVAAAWAALEGAPSPSREAALWAAGPSSLSRAAAADAVSAVLRRTIARVLGE
jgi:hypothetical protein